MAKELTVNEVQCGNQLSISDKLVNARDISTRQRSAMGDREVLGLSRFKLKYTAAIAAT